LNKVGVSAIQRALEECDLIILDEIGKMELLSPQFREAVWQAINGSKRVLGTIMLNPNPFCDEIKHHPEVKTLLVTGDNRRQALAEMQSWLAENESHA
jgi:nucleoside-triphosphatase